MFLYSSDFAVDRSFPKMFPGSVSSSCSISETRRVALATKPVINDAREKDRELFMISGTYTWACVTQIFHSMCIVSNNLFTSVY